MPMKLGELTPNCVYRVKHSSGMIRWKFTHLEIHEPYRSYSSFRESRTRKRYHGINLDTGREVILKSLVKVVHELESPHGTELGRGNY